MRVPDWNYKLSEYLAESKNVQFVWGVTDCVMWAAKGLERLTGQNHYAEYEGYTTREGAEEIIKKFGGIENLISRHLGPGHRNFLKAGRGDMVVVKSSSGMIAGLVDDSGQTIMLPGEKGMTRLPLKQAWRIWSY